MPNRLQLEFFDFELIDGHWQVAVARRSDSDIVLSGPTRISFETGLLWYFSRYI